jgi:hypothetical protein
LQTQNGLDLLIGLDEITMRKKTSEQALLPLVNLLNAGYNFAKSVLGSLKQGDKNV